MHARQRITPAALAAATIACAVTAVAATTAQAAPKAQSLLRSAFAVDGQAETITLPVFKGRTAAGAPTWYVVVDSSSKTDAAKRGVNFAPRLRNALGTKAVQKARLAGQTVVFSGTVDFSPARVVVPSTDGFPPTKFAPGAIGDARARSRAALLEAPFRLRVALVRLRLPRSQAAAAVTRWGP